MPLPDAILDNPMLVATLLVHAAATLFMMGLIWFVQIVHYPLMRAVGPDGFVRYEVMHTRRTTWVVLPPMLLELISAIALVTIYFPSTNPGSGLAIAGAAMLAVIWASTFLVQVPCHERLSDGFNEAAWSWLVRSNWIRTVLWSARGIIALLIPIVMLQQ
ncbi:MAG: hypothetical protein ACOC0P_07340 [Planctomycetota bacterium]